MSDRMTLDHIDTLTADNRDLTARIAGLEAERDHHRDGLVRVRAEANAATARAAELEAERDKFKVALDKINDIRDSIVGLAQIGWSEHIYPLVSALDEACIKGMPYKEARPHFTGILDRAIKAEDRAAELEAALRALVESHEFCDGSDDGIMCRAFATREEDGRVYCDGHGKFDDGEEAPDMANAAPLRAALLLLAKGGTP